MINKNEIISATIKLKFIKPSIVINVNLPLLKNSSIRKFDDDGTESVSDYLDSIEIEYDNLVKGNPVKKPKTKPIEKPMLYEGELLSTPILTDDPKPIKYKYRIKKDDSHNIIYLKYDESLDNLSDEELWDLYNKGKKGVKASNRLLENESLKDHIKKPNRRFKNPAKVSIKKDVEVIINNNHYFTIPFNYSDLIAMITSNKNIVVTNSKIQSRLLVRDKNTGKLGITTGNIYNDMMEVISYDTKKGGRYSDGGTFSISYFKINDVMAVPSNYVELYTYFFRFRLKKDIVTSAKYNKPSQLKYLKKLSGKICTNNDLTFLISYRAINNETERYDEKSFFYIETSAGLILIDIEDIEFLAIDTKKLQRSYLKKNTEVLVDSKAVIVDDRRLPDTLKKGTIVDVARIQECPSNKLNSKVSVVVDNKKQLVLLKQLKAYHDKNNETTFKEKSIVALFE